MLEGRDDKYAGTCCLRFNVSYSKVLNKNKEKKYEGVLEINTNSMEI